MMLLKRLLSDDVAGLNRESVESSEQPRTIKAIRRMTVRSECVRRVTLPDGRPAPEPFSEPAYFHILVWVPIMYIGEIIGSCFMTVLLVFSMNSGLLIFGSKNAGDCPNAVGSETYALAALVGTKTILALVATYWMCCSRRIQEEYLDEQRIMLRRLEVHVVTLSHKTLLNMLYFCDLLTFVSVFICVPIWPDARTSCFGFYYIFLIILFVYQLIVLIRLPLLLCIFVFGRRCWLSLKR